MALRPRIPTPPPQAIATFNFSDIDEGTGNIILFGYISQLTGGKDQHLTTQSTIYSADIETANTTSVGDTFTKQIDLDFDLTAFNFPKTIEGTAFFQVGFLVDSLSVTSRGYLIVQIRHVDGASVETDLVSAQSQTLATGGAAVKAIAAMSLVIPRTHFKRGEILRVTVEFWTNTTGGPATVLIALGHDPRNRDGSQIIPSTDSPDTITQMVTHIPFRIEL